MGRLEPNVFFVRRAGRYYDFSGVSGMDLAEDSRAFAFLDIDGDGNLDIVLKSRLGPQLRVYQNACGAPRKSMILSLRGTRSNRDAIGACVEMDGQVKWLSAGSGYLSQHTKMLHFGLGDRDQANKTRIHWPSGEVQELPPLVAGFLHEVTEGDAGIHSKPLSPPAKMPESAALSNRQPFPPPYNLVMGACAAPRIPPGTDAAGPSRRRVAAAPPGAVTALDLRQLRPDLAAAYAIVRRYLFDYRVELETPLCLLVDPLSRVRKIYADPPEAAALAADLRTLAGPLPDPRGLPFPGIFTGRPRRDYYKLGGALLQAGYPEQALPYLEEMLRRTPDNPKALVAAGRIHLEAKRLPQAREALLHAVAVDPRLPEAWNELGGVEVQAGRLSEALRCYEKALALSPGLSYALLNAAQTSDKLDRTEDAERLYRQLLSAEPRNPDAANGLGLSLAKQGRTDEARKLFELAISVRRDDSSAINNLGVLYADLGQTNDAIAAFQYGIKIAPDDEQLYLNLARIWVRAGDREKARELMNALLARKPDSTVAQRALKDLGAQ